MVTFDFDGTLADSFPFFMRVFNTLADAHGFRRVEPGEADSLRGLDAGAIMRHVGLPLWKFPRVAMQFKSMMAAEIAGIPLFEGVPRTLQRLHDGGLRLALVSSNSEANVRGVLGDSAALFTHYECSASLLGKRQNLRQLRKHAQLPAAELLYVGDELRDLDAARDEGIPFGAVTWGYTHAHALRERAPDFVFERVEDVANRLLGEAP